jgi:hypothetical protein
VAEITNVAAWYPLTGHPPVGGKYSAFFSIRMCTRASLGGVKENLEASIRDGGAALIPGGANAAPLPASGVSYVRALDRAVHATLANPNASPAE